MRHAAALYTSIMRGLLVKCAIPASRMGFPIPGVTKRQLVTVIAYILSDYVPFWQLAYGQLDQKDDPLQVSSG